jgi:hypothetical protein
MRASQAVGPFRMVVNSFVTKNADDPHTPYLASRPELDCSPCLPSVDKGAAWAAFLPDRFMPQACVSERLPWIRLWGLAASGACAPEETIRVAKRMIADPDAPMRHGYRTARWKSSPGSSCRRLA